MLFFFKRIIFKPIMQNTIGNVREASNEVSKEEVLQYVRSKYPNGMGGSGYRKNLIEFLKTITGRPINSTLLLEIPSKNKEKQNYCNRRWEEVYSLDKLPFVNWNHPDGKHLQYGQWCLLSNETHHVPKSNRGVNKKIASQVFERDHSTCTRCGAKAGDKHHIFPDKMVKLHVGHLVPFVHEKPDKKYTVDDFVTLCSMCNEGEKANPIQISQRIILLQNMISRLQKELANLLNTNTNNNI